MQDTQQGAKAPQLFALLKCPHCTMRLTYVGAKAQDRDELDALVEMQTQLEERAMMAPDERVGLLPLPEPDLREYKCYFCGVAPLSTSMHTWRLAFGHFSARDTQHAELRKQILARDKCTCVDCNLKLPVHMEVRHIDGNHDNNSPENLVCVCPFCHMRDHLGPTGFANAAYVIGSTRISQAVLNALVLVCWYVVDRTPTTEDIRIERKQGEDYSGAILRETAQKLLTDLRSSGLKWSEKTTKSVVDPYVFGQLLSKLRYEQPDGDHVKHLGPFDQTEAYAKRNVSLASLCLFPRIEVFSAQCKDWFTYLDKVRPLESWDRGFGSFLSTLGFKDPVQLYEVIQSYNKALASIAKSKPKSKAALPRPAAIAPGPTAPAGTVPSATAAQAPVRPLTIPLLSGAVGVTIGAVTPRPAAPASMPASPEPDIDASVTEQAPASTAPELGAQVAQHTSDPDPATDSATIAPVHPFGTTGLNFLALHAPPPTTVEHAPDISEDEYPEVDEDHDGTEYVSAADAIEPLAPVDIVVAGDPDDSGTGASW